MATGDMNAFEWLQWFLTDSFAARLGEVADDVKLGLANQTRIEERITRMEISIKEKIDALTAQVAADSEAKTKVFGEIKGLLEKLATNNGDVAAQIEAAVKAAKEAQMAEDKTAFDAANAEVVSSLESLRASHAEGVTLTKTLDEAIPDAPVVEPTPVQ
jgi:hypothetical protein